MGSADGAFADRGEGERVAARIAARGAAPAWPWWYDLPMLMETQTLRVADIYVPVKRRTTLDPKTVDAIAESMMEVGQQTPILVRPDGARYVLVEGLHRLEACKALGEETIEGQLVKARLT